MDRRLAEVIDPARSFPPRPWSSDWTPRGVISALEPLVNLERRARLAQLIDARIGSVTAVLDAPHDPHNGGAILRSCDAFGIPELHVVTRRHAFLASHRMARGAERWVDVTVHDTPAAAARALHARG